MLRQPQVVFSPLGESVLPTCFCRCLKGFSFSTLRSETFPRNFSGEKFAALQWGKGFDTEIYAKIESYSGVREIQTINLKLLELAEAMRCS